MTFICDNQECLALLHSAWLPASCPRCGAVTMNSASDHKSSLPLNNLESHASTRSGGNRDSGTSFRYPELSEIIEQYIGNYIDNYRK